jgi:ABC-type multidrug transport system permease subunit
LILLLFYLARTRTIPTADFRLLLVSASLVPAVYLVSLLVSYANIFISQLIVLSIIPLFIVMRKIFCKISEAE